MLPSCLHYPTSSSGKNKIMTTSTYLDTRNLEAAAVIDKNIDKLHYIPCNVDYNGHSQTDKYFETTTRTEEKGEFSNSFRGRPLRGTIFPVPKGYTGLLIKEPKKAIIEGDDRHLQVAKTFSRFHYWELDEKPSADKLNEALEILSIAKMLHRPIDVDSSQKSTVGN